MYRKSQYYSFPHNTAVSESFVLPISIAVSVLSLWPELLCGLCFSVTFIFQEIQASVQFSKEENGEFIETKQPTYPPLSS